MLCTLAQFKARYDVEGSGDDAMITQILTGVSAQLAAACGRICQAAPCLEKTSLTELITVHDDRVHTLMLSAFPVISITSVKEAFYGAFDDADALVENEAYQLHPQLGLLYRIGYWLRGRLTVQVVYSGGHTPAGDEVGAGEIALPDDIVEAALQQAGFTWQRRASLGLTGESVQGGSISAYAQDKLLPGVAETMRRYRRLYG